MKWNRLVNESGSDKSVGISCVIKVSGNTPEDAIRNFQNELTKLGGQVSEVDGEPDIKLVEKYRYWDEENDGDVFFNIYKSPEAELEIYDGRYMS